MCQNVIFCNSPCAYTCLGGNYSAGERQHYGEVKVDDMGVKWKERK